jgi:hypothetical protein
LSDAASFVPMTGRRRSQRVVLSMRITVWGDAARGPFNEVAQTLVVNAHGALIALEADVSEGQQLQIQSPATSEIMLCRVAHVGPVKDGKRHIGVEFAEPAPRFWQITFPPDDWSDVLME